MGYWAHFFALYPYFSWFLSAFVMMYHRFPRVSAKEKMQKLDMLSQTGDSLPDISSVTARLPVA